IAPYGMHCSTHFIQPTQRDSSRTALRRCLSNDSAPEGHTFTHWLHPTHASSITCTTKLGLNIENAFPVSFGTHVQRNPPSKCVARKQQYVKATTFSRRGARPAKQKR